MISLNRAERRSLATATALVLAGTGLRIGFGSGPEDRAWEPRPDAVAGSADFSALQRSVEEGVRREERARTPLADGERLDPNFADATELRRLPGIGPAKAGAIVRDRRENGPFRTLADLERVSGLGSRSVARLAPHLRLGTAPGNAHRSEDLVDLNQAGAEELTRLPGIGPALAQRIVEQRRIRGSFGRTEDLLVVPGIGPVTVEKIRNRVRIR